jgi:GT2 family glycosyltransferase
MISLSIIIVSYRCWSRLDACLNSIALQQLNNIEVIVVDNDSDDGLAQSFMENHQQVQFILQDFNGGFSQACNRGASDAKGDWLLFLNPDTILESNTLQPLIEKVNEESSWKLIGIKQLNDHRKDTHPHGLFLKWWNVWPSVRILQQLLNPSKSKHRWSKDIISYPDWISGAFVLIRKKDLEELGGWDERFWMYYEDMDLSKRAADRGWLRVMYNELICTHSHGGSSRINPEVKAITKTEVILSAIKYLKKHNNPFYALLGKYMYLLSRFIDIIISYPFSATKRAMTKKLLKARLDLKEQIS